MRRLASLLRRAPYVLAATLVTVILAVASRTASDRQLFVQTSAPVEAIVLGGERYAELAYLQTPQGLEGGVRVPMRGRAAVALAAVPDTVGILRVVAVQRSLLSRATAALTMARPGPAVTVAADALAWQREWSLQWLFAFAFAYAGLRAAAGLLRLAADPEVRPVMFAAAAVGAVCLALIPELRFNHGPDEYMHYGSLQWYTAHLRPQLMGDAGYMNELWRQSYVVGVPGDATYLLTARLSDLFDQFLRAAPHVAPRLAQLALLVAVVGLAGLALPATTAAALAAAVVIVPQMAYLTTYLNGDLLSFALGFVALALVARPERAGTARFLAAAALLANLKGNYVVLFLPFAVFLALRLRRLPRGEAGRLAALLAAAAPLLFYRRIVNLADQWAAGRSYVQEALATLSTDYARLGGGIDLVREHLERQLGLRPLGYDLLTSLPWYQMSLESFFGRFGYMDYPLAWPLVGYAMLLVAGLVLYAGRTLVGAGLVAATAGLALAASLYYSIAVGPQPQGRYLFPALGVVLVLAAPALNRLRWPVALAALPTMAALVQFAARAG